MERAGRIENKVAIVTGGASGIGAATAKRFVSEGARVVIADRNVLAGEQVAAQLGATFRELDVSSEEQWAAAIDDVLARFGKLDILVNNAGVGVVKDVESTTLEEWRFVHKVNADGTFLGCREGIRAMKANAGNGGGSIVNVSSVAGLVGDGSLAAYCSSKGAVRLLTKSVALYCAQKRYGIRCNSVHPSFVATPMVDAMVNSTPQPELARERLAKTAALGHMGEAADVAAMILFLASDEAKFITGAEMVVDGGATAR